MVIDRDFWAGRRVLLTGHTGFKGAWTALWLQELGASVTGLAPSGPPTRPSLYELARVGEGMRERTADVRDAQALREAVAGERPEVVLHLAAQPLVRRSYREPALTYEVNVMGTVNVLEAVRQVGKEVRAVVVVTSDKCYENLDSHTLHEPPAGAVHGSAVSAMQSSAAGGVQSSAAGGVYGSAAGGVQSSAAGGVYGSAAGAMQSSAAGEVQSSAAGTAADGPRRGRRFVEGDPMGGEDPYSSSKACAELVTAAYRSSFFATGEGPCVASARAGNVIGGGDWGADRLIPDIVRAVQAGESVRVRNPDAVRPWQHVLNPLSGYLVLAQELHREAGGAPAGSPLVQAPGSASAAGVLPPQAAGAWNFGPAPEDARTVGWIVQRLAEHWGGALEWVSDADGGPPEAGHLALDSAKAEHGLGWRPTWGLEEALERVVSWHEAHRRGEDMRAVSLAQIAELA